MLLTRLYRACIIAEELSRLVDTVEVTDKGQNEIRISADDQAAGLPVLPAAHERVRLLD